jgi:hypothetical protein
VSRKIIEVDSDMIDKALEDLAKLILRLDENMKKTRREQAEKVVKLSLLVKRCEEIMASEAFDYVSLFSPMNESTPKQ